MSRTRLIFLSIALALVAGPILAQGGAKAGKAATKLSTPPPSFDSTLQKTRWKVAKDADGDWKTEIEWSSEKRSQVVFVRGTAADLAPLKAREIWSLCWRGDARPDVDVLERVFSTKYKIGAFQLEKTESGKYSMYFRVDVPEDVKPAYLEKAISLVAEAADNMEKELTPDKDDL